MYHPANSDTRAFLDHLDTVLTALHEKSKYKDLIICGDLNIDASEKS